MTDTMNICKTCICTDTTPYVTINEHGICSECVQSRNRPEPDFHLFRKTMEEEFDRIRTQKIPYHVLLMFSGGKDSSYLLYLLKRKYRLRVLALFLQHPFIHNDVAAHNTEQVARKLNTDLIQFHTDEKISRELIRVALSESGMGENAGCFVCHSICELVCLNMAAQMKIPCVLDGRSLCQTYHPISMDSETAREDFLGRYAHVREIFHKAFGNAYEGTLYDYDVSRFRADAFPAVISPLTFLEYDPEKIISELDENGILEEKNAGTGVTNCDLLHFFAYLSYKNHNCHPYAKAISSDLRQGLPTLMDQFSKKEASRLTREDHVRILEEYKRILFYLAQHPDHTGNDLKALESECHFMFDRLGVSDKTDILGRISKIRHYADYFDIDLLAERDEPPGYANDQQYLCPDPSMAVLYEQMTFPAFRHLLKEVSPKGPYIAISHSILGMPSGLILADMMDGQTPEVLSVFVAKEFRNQGIGTVLMTRLEKKLTRRGRTGVFGIYTANKPSARVLERVLEKCGWESPTPRQLICTSKGEDVEQMMRSDWMNNYRLPKNFKIFPWTEVTPEELEEIRAWPYDPPYYHSGLTPFLKVDEEFEPINSLGLRYKGEIVGWLITVRIGPGTVRYDRLFVRKEFQRTGRAIPLLAESIRRQYAHEGHIPTKGGIWRTQADNAPMVRFIRKRLGPYLTSLIETKESFKALK
ncbi:GNAT family N-acetyltransferase [Desulfonema magnum]|uniref:GNAT domain-containing protein n=1 Tax=Desulfonema magnum TaxID=45655 RepID=A0A975BH73_9BACT|nr:GNAT family N-acetyltransferase [Desulfonema magnum]QTA85220.1 GNAT domain-containing protein [Desulfonema magnum]